MSDVVVGTCGFSYYDPPDGWRDEYESKLAAFAAAFDACEINRSFYALPTVETARRWRREAGPGFTFLVKAWQALTHPIASPTWRGKEGALADEHDRDEVGYLRPTDTVVDAWRRTRRIAEALEAPAVLLQTPPSFGASGEHERNVRAFVDRIDRGDLALAWEPRGDWDDHPERVRELCADLDLIHVVDPLRRDPVDEGDLGYLRPHGLNADPYDHDYHYSDEEIALLADRVRALGADRGLTYCLLNNYGMYEDARALREELAEW